VRSSSLYPTLLDAYTLVLFRLGKTAASLWLEQMSNATLINPGPEDYRQAAAKVPPWTDQPVTLLDAVRAGLATRLGLEVWTYDQHFDFMRVAVWRWAPRLSRPQTKDRSGPYRQRQQASSWHKS
jgi:predicted nucleic acid-binding protein